MSIENIGLSGQQTTEIRGFPGGEVINIVSPDIRTASVELGKAMSGSVKECLKKITGNSEYPQMRKEAERFYKRLIKLREKNDFRLSNGVDPFTDYFNALSGYCEGAEVGIVDGIMLQLGMDIGCQTLMFRDKKKGTVFAAHTEEDAEEHRASGDAARGKKLVKMKIGNTKTVTFLAYPGLCSFGPAFSMVETPDAGGKRQFFVANDFLSANDEDNEKSLLLNHLVTFMIADCGSIDLVKELVAKLRPVCKKGFVDGAVVTMAESGVNPSITSLEFAADDIQFVEPAITETREVHTGINYPTSKRLRRKSWITTKRKDSVLERAYDRRQRRLELLGSLVILNNIHDLTKVLANPYGDVVKEKGQRGWKSGFPNTEVAAYTAVVMEPGKPAQMIVGKGFPEPIIGKEYSLDGRTRQYVSRVIR